MKNKAGFTLMEMMVVIAIIGILSAIATPNVISWMRNSQFNSAVRSVQAAVEDMRLYAVKENAEAVIVFTDGTNAFQTDKWKRGTDTHNIRTRAMAGGIEIRSDFTNDRLVFNSRGMADESGTITIQSPTGLMLQINVWITGSSRIS